MGETTYLSNQLLRMPSPTSTIFGENLLCLCNMSNWHIMAAVDDEDSSRLLDDAADLLAPLPPLPATMCVRGTPYLGRWTRHVSRRRLSTRHAGVGSVLCAKM
eukprot:6809663-Prorocentrum_lima.AAC.1